MLKDTSDRQYCAIGVWIFGRDNPALLRAEGEPGVPGKVVIFDTLAMAQEFLPQLGMGRLATWSADRETVAFTPLSTEPGTFNRACVITKYDPYHLPSGMPPDLLSETLGKEWKRHIMWSAAFFDVGGNMVERPDGSIANLAR